jgi:hypothetical protein
MVCYKLVSSKFITMKNLHLHNLCLLFWQNPCTILIVNNAKNGLNAKQ